MVKIQSESTMERIIVSFAKQMNNMCLLKKEEEINISQRIIKQMKKHLHNYEKKQKELDSIMIYLLWEEFSDLYRKWMNN